MHETLGNQESGIGTAVAEKEIFQETVLFAKLLDVIETEYIETNDAPKFEEKKALLKHVRGLAEKGGVEQALNEILTARDAGLISPSEKFLFTEAIDSLMPNTQELLERAATLYLAREESEKLGEDETSEIEGKLRGLVSSGEDMEFLRETIAQLTSPKSEIQRLRDMRSKLRINRRDLSPADSNALASATAKFKVLRQRINSFWGVAISPNLRSVIEDQISSGRKSDTSDTVRDVLEVEERYLRGKVWKLPKETFEDFRRTIGEAALDEVPAAGREASGADLTEILMGERDRRASKLLSSVLVISKAMGVRPYYNVRGMSDLYAALSDWDREGKLYEVGEAREEEIKKAAVTLGEFLTSIRNWQTRLRADMDYKRPRIARLSQSIHEEFLGNQTVEQLERRIDNLKSELLAAKSDITSSEGDIRRGPFKVVDQALTTLLSARNQVESLEREIRETKSTLAKREKGILPETEKRHVSKESLDEAALLMYLAKDYRDQAVATPTRGSQKEIAALLGAADIYDEKAAELLGQEFPLEKAG